MSDGVVGILSEKPLAKGSEQSSRTLAAGPFRSKSNQKFEDELKIDRIFERNRRNILAILLLSLRKCMVVKREIPSFIEELVFSGAWKG